jgi:hypothetical protein
MLYFDTSFLTPLVRQEATSAQVEHFVGSLPAGELAISHWTKVEFSSLLARHVRMGGLTAEAAKTVGSGFDTMVDESFAVLLPEADDFDLAREISRPSPDRAAGWRCLALGHWRESAHGDHLQPRQDVPEGW